MAAEAFGIAAGAIGLAATVFQTAKRIRDIIHTAKLEKQEIVELLQENQEEMDLLAELYNEHKEHLDQTKLTQNLERLQAKIDEHYIWLVEADDGRPHRRTPTLKAIWKAGDLKPRLETWNRDIGRMRSHWQSQVNLRMIALLQDTKSQVLDRLDNQDRAQTSSALTLVETIRAEATEVIKVIQHTTVQTRTRSLSVHSHVEPDGFTSLTTRVAVETTSSLATFSILSPDASLSYDKIKMRLEEYSQHLESDSPTIEFFTEHGRMVVCRKEANKIEDLLNSAKELLQNMIEAKNVPTIEAIHRLRDLATVLDQLKLQDECMVVGNCAIKLAQALGLRAEEFQWELAQTMTLIAILGAYESRMRPLFIQAISICEASVIEDGSALAKMKLFLVLRYAGTYATKYPALSAQWLGRAIDLIAELPPALVTILPNEHHGIIYGSYGMSLCKLKQYPKALAAQEHAVALYRSLASSHNGPRHKQGLACALHTHGIILVKMGHLENALRVEREAVSLLRALVVRGEEGKKELVDALLNHGNTLYEKDRLEDALSVQRETISLCRALVIHWEEEHKERLVLALQTCGYTLSKMGRLEDARSVQRENVTLLRALVVHGQVKHQEQLAVALLSYGSTLFKMGSLEDASNTQRETVSLFRALLIHGEEKRVNLADALLSYGNTLYETGRLEEALSVQRETVSLCRALVVHEEEHKERLALALQSCGCIFSKMGRLEDTLSVQRESVTLFRAIVVHQVKHEEQLALALVSYGNTLFQMECLEDALNIQRETISLFRALVIHREDQRVNLADALLRHGYTLYAMGRLEDALSVQRETVSLYRALVIHGEGHKEKLALALLLRFAEY